jgi:hypothetical protein
MLGCPILRPPRAFDNELLTGLIIQNTPTDRGSTTPIIAIEERLQLNKRVLYFTVVCSTSCRGSANFAAALDSPLDTGIKSDIDLVRRAQAENESHKGMRIFVDIEWGVLRAAGGRVLRVSEPAWHKP